MNADRLRRLGRPGTALISMCVGAAVAGTVPDSPPASEAALYSNHQVTDTPPSPEYPYLFADPLRSGARRLEERPALPGDAEPFTCPGRPDVPQPLGLDAAVDLALCNSPQVQAAWAAVKLQAAAVGQSRAAWLPTVNATVSRLRSRTVYPGIPAANDATQGYTKYGSVTWRLFDFGARAADNTASSRLLAAALASRDAALQKALGGVVQAYFDAVTSRAAYDARTAATQIAQQTLAATRRRESAGTSPLSDTLQARSALAKAMLAQQRAEGDFHKALAVLVYAMGLPPVARLELVSEPAVPQAQAVSDLAGWLDEATANHPAILAARAQVDAAHAKVDVVRRQGLPTLDFSGNYYQNGYPNQGLQPTRSSTTTIGMTLTIPLFEGFARTYQVRSAQAQVDQSKAQLRDTELQISSTIVKDHADASAALANLGASSNWLDAAQESVASAMRRYDKGAADILELLTAESEVADAQQERVRCVSEWRSARLRLLADSGMLGRAAIQPSQANDFKGIEPVPR